MADKGTILAMVLLVAGLIIGGGIGYFVAPLSSVPPDVTPSGGIKPIYTDAFPFNMDEIVSYRIDDKQIMYVWSVPTYEGYERVYWTYVKIGG